jgi:hypothetical protein
MMKKGITWKRVGLAVFAIFLVLQVHSYWQFRYMLTEYINPEITQPLLLAFEVGAIRIYHQRKLSSGGYLTPEHGWKAMTPNEINAYVKNSMHISGASEGVGDVYFGNFQNHKSGCSMIHIDINCVRRYVLFNNYLCSFPKNLQISYEQFECLQIFIDGRDIYSESRNKTHFIKNWLTKL